MSFDQSGTSLNSVFTMVPNTQKIQDSLQGFRLQSPQQQRPAQQVQQQQPENQRQQQYQHQQQAGNEICQCKNGMKIFERSVEDQCSDVWYSDTSDEDKSDIEEELDPLKEVEKHKHRKGRHNGAVNSCLDSKAGGGGLQGQGSGNMRKIGTSRTASCGTTSTNKKSQICSRCHRLKPVRSHSRSAFDLEELAINRPRTNSIMLQLSRQTTRQSFLDGNNTTTGSIVTHSANDGNPLDETMCRTRSRSSFTAIPTHVYSLEKYISTELDSATESFFDKDVKISDSSPTEVQSSIASPNFPSSSASISLSFASLSSNSNINDKLSPPPIFLDQRKRRKSHIEMSLSESFQ
ncbi:uncharacterized protein Ecym_2425 [Eremothecium cymbalariae DBVPG|uniref:Uncharacterized protein n=1 Tax=Eremothecium cymbalariae (strain CBS 270.75 / DBVPG 7215 / KCTC 17166 / NRRL Y-17582) TaxID=931890 RepID=G8JP98_ERECY|nr:Hypothetical protein Ecym_2425 [Eremothecium cymbalariae DBVPG\